MKLGSGSDMIAAMNLSCGPNGRGLKSREMPKHGRSGPHTIRSVAEIVGVWIATGFQRY